MPPKKSEPNPKPMGGAKANATCKPRPRPLRQGVKPTEPHKYPPMRQGKTVPGPPKIEEPVPGSVVGTTDLSDGRNLQVLRGIANSKYTPMAWPFSDEKRKLIFQALEQALAMGLMKQDGRLINSCVQTFGVLHGHNVSEQQFAFKYAQPAPVQEHRVVHEGSEPQTAADFIREMMQNPEEAAKALALSRKLAGEFLAAQPKE